MKTKNLLMLLGSFFLVACMPFTQVSQLGTPNAVARIVTDTPFQPLPTTTPVPQSTLVPTETPTTTMINTPNPVAGPMSQVFRASERDKALSRFGYTEWDQLIHDKLMLDPNHSPNQEFIAWNEAFGMILEAGLVIDVLPPMPITNKVITSLGYIDTISLMVAFNGESTPVPVIIGVEKNTGLPLWLIRGGIGQESSFSQIITYPTTQLSVADLFGLVGNVYNFAIPLTPNSPDTTKWPVQVSAWVNANTNHVTAEEIQLEAIMPAHSYVTDVAADASQFEGLNSHQALLKLISILSDGDSLLAVDMFNLKF